MKPTAMLPLLGLLGFATAAGGPDTAKYVREVAEWRKAQQADLTRPEGWLSLAGLSWLKEGDNSIGSDPKSAVPLPESAPAKLGTLVLHGGQVWFKPLVECEVASVNGAMVKAMPGGNVEVKPDAYHLSIGSIGFIVIQRGKRTGVRIWDHNSPNLKNFKGEKWFPISEEYKVTADFVAYNPPKTMPITNVLGDTSMVPNPGYVTFKLRGKTVRLEAQGAGDGLFFNFRDATSGVKTYHAGRFLDASGPKDGKVVLDFNKATNPPCAFTSFATCPLPPRANFLKVAIPAGEQYVHPDIEE